MKPPTRRDTVANGIQLHAKRMERFLLDLLSLLAEHGATLTYVKGALKVTVRDRATVRVNYLSGSLKPAEFIEVMDTVWVRNTEPEMDAAAGEEGDVEPPTRNDDAPPSDAATATGMYDLNEGSS